MVSIFAYGRVMYTCEIHQVKTLMVTLAEDTLPTKLYSLLVEIQIMGLCFLVYFFRPTQVGFVTNI